MDWAMTTARLHRWLLAQIMTWHDNCETAQMTSRTDNDMAPNRRQTHYLNQLEQIERPRSEIPIAAPWLPILVIHIRSQVKTRQDCFLQKEARVCVSNTFVLEDSMFKWCFLCGRWTSDGGSRYANVNIVVEWKGRLAEGIVVWND